MKLLQNLLIGIGVIPIGITILGTISEEENKANLLSNQADVYTEIVDNLNDKNININELNEMVNYIKLSQIDEPTAYSDIITLAEYTEASPNWNDYAIKDAPISKMINHTNKSNLGYSDIVTTSDYIAPPLNWDNISQPNLTLAHSDIIAAPEYSDGKINWNNYVEEKQINELFLQAGEPLVITEELQAEEPLVITEELQAEEPLVITEELQAFHKGIINFETFVISLPWNCVTRA